MTLTDGEFLGYVELHSQTERHAFSNEDADLLMAMAGVEEIRVDNCGLGGFVGIGQWEAERLVKLARKRLAEKKGQLGE